MTMQEYQNKVSKITGEVLYNISAIDVRMTKTIVNYISETKKINRAMSVVSMLDFERKKQILGQIIKCEDVLKKTYSKFTTSMDSLQQLRNKFAHSNTHYLNNLNSIDISQLEYIELEIIPKIGDDTNVFRYSLEEHAINMEKMASIITAIYGIDLALNPDTPLA